MSDLEGINSENTPNKRNKIKAHFNKYKIAYIVVGTASVTAIVTVVIMKRFATVQNLSESANTIVQQRIINSDVVNKITTQNLVRRGHPGKIVYWLEGDKVFSSIGEAAEVTGLNRNDISRALRGLADDVSGNHFRDFGDMI